MMASLIPLRLLFGFIFVLNTFPVKNLSSPIRFNNVEDFEKAAAFWVDNECVFPARSAYAKNVLRPDECVLEICRSLKTDEEKFVTTLCSHFFSISKLLCNETVSPFERQHLEEKSINKYALNTSWDVCVAANKSGIDFPYMTDDHELCEKNCVSNTVISPVCRLLVAAVVNYEEAFSEENTANIDKTKQNGDGLKEDEHIQNATGNEKTQEEPKGTTKAVNEEGLLEVGDGSTVKPKDHPVTPSPRKNESSLNDIDNGITVTLKVTEVVDEGNENNRLHLMDANNKTLTETGYGIKREESGQTPKDNDNTNMEEESVDKTRTANDANSNKKGSGNDTGTGSSGLTKNDGNETIQNQRTGEGATDEQSLENDGKTTMKTGGGDGGVTEMNKLRTDGRPTGKNGTEADKVAGAGANGQPLNDDDKTTTRKMMEGDPYSNTGTTAANNETHNGDNTPSSKDLESNGSTTTTTTTLESNRGHITSDAKGTEHEVDTLDPESNGDAHGNDNERNKFDQNIQRNPLILPPIPDAPVGRPVGINLGEEEPPSGHFMAYFLTAVVLCVAGYVIYHNKKKIMAFVLEGRRDVHQRRRSTGTSGSESTAKYHKLQPSVEEVMPSLEKSTTSKDYIY